MHPETSIDSVEEAATRLARLLTAEGGGLRDPTGSDLEFEPALSIRPLARAASGPPDVWAVDGGQGLVADAKCVQVYVTRSARVRWSPADGGRTVLEDEGPLLAHLLGLGEDRHTLAAIGAPVSADAAVDINLLRDWGEWSEIARSVAECSPGGLVLVDGDLQPDWRIAASWLASLFEQADDRQVTLIGITKHTSLSWGGAPLLAVLERAAPQDRACWWAPVGRTRPDVGPGIQVVVARLDPDARFSFRVDLPGHAHAPTVLGALSTLCDDAAFPGYPYPLGVADRLAACPRWVRADVWSRMDEIFDAAGVPLDIRERAFTDRHSLMERY